MDGRFIFDGQIIQGGSSNSSPHLNITGCKKNSDEQSKENSHAKNDDMIIDPSSPADKNRNSSNKNSTAKKSF